MVDKDKRVEPNRPLPSCRVDQDTVLSRVIGGGGNVCDDAGDGLRFLQPLALKLELLLPQARQTQLQPSTNAST